MFKWIIEKVEAFFYLSLPKPISDAQHQAATEEIVRSIVSNLSRGNNSLQQGYYMTESDITQLREKNYKYSFLK
jgi:hypothetical protein